MIISKLLMGTTVVGFLAAGALYLLYERANAQADAPKRCPERLTLTIALPLTWTRNFCCL